MTRPTETPPPSEPRPLTDATAADFLEAHEVAVLAFVSEGDGPSDRYRPRLALVGARLASPRLGIGVLDVSTDRLVADALGVKGVPTTMVFVRGELADRLMGAAPESILEETLEARLRAS